MCPHGISNINDTSGPTGSTELLLVSQTTGEVQSEDSIAVRVHQNVSLVGTPARMDLPVSVMAVPASPQRSSQTLHGAVTISVYIKSWQDTMKCRLECIAKLLNSRDPT